MKKSSIILLFFLISGCCYSQPTITYNGNAPQIGDVYYFSNTEDALDPGPSGANQTWDYTEINVTSTSQATILNPASTPFDADFSECNQVFNFSGTSTYIYYDLTQSMMTHYGEGFDQSPPMIIYFSDPEIEMEYPFSYNDNFTDDYFASYEYEGLTTHRSGTSNITADAWGSVTTPTNTYNNVLRIKNVKTQRDSVWMDDIFIHATTTTYTHYGWHAGNSHTPVMAISIIDTDLGTSYASHYTTITEHIDNISAGINGLRIYPNPANSIVNISLVPSDISGIQLTIIDLTGKEIMWHEENFSSATAHSFRLDLSDLSPGVYFLKFKDAYATTTRKIMVN